MVVSGGKDLLDNCDGNNNSGNDDDDGDNNDQAINLPDTATAATSNAATNDEGMPRKILVTATIRRKMDAADANILEGGALNGPTTKLRQYSSLTFESLALPRSGCS